MLVFCCRLCTAFLFQLLLQMLILPTVPSQTHFLPFVFSPWWLVHILVMFFSMSKCYCCGFLTQSAFLPVILSFSLCFSLPSVFRSQVLSRFLIQFLFSPCDVSGFSVTDVSTAWSSLYSCYSFLCLFISTPCSKLV